MSSIRPQNSLEEHEPDQDLSGCEPALEFLSQVREDLLSAVEQSASGAERAWRERATVAQSEQLQDTKHVQPPKELGRFRIQGLLGSGGFAEVFRAYDPHLDRDVALKVPNARALATPDAQIRFQREARLAATLSHPSIVPVYESGCCDELSYIAYEYCPGESLASWFEARQKDISTREAATLVQILAEAVQHAHHRGVLHRDLKPGNVLVLTAEGKEEGTPPIRITDFGLARHFAADGENLTVEGTQLGTPAYMSPEQAEGAVCSTTSDIYALGVILYELLTGQLPHQRSNDLATLRAIQQDPVTPVNQLDSTVDPFLTAICMKCLERSPEHRYQTAYELECDLAAWLAGRPIQAKRPTVRQRIQIWAKQNPLLASATTTTLLSLTLGFGISFALWQQADKNFTRSEEQRSRAQAHVQKLENTIKGVLDEYLVLLEENPEGADLHRPILDKVLKTHFELVNSEAGQLQSASQTLHKYVLIAKLYARIGRFEEAKQVCNQALQLTEILLNNPSTTELALEFRARIGLRQGHLAKLSSNHDLAVQIADKAIAMLDRLERIPPGLGLDLYRLRGLLHTQASEIEEAVAAFRRAEAFGEALLDRDILSRTAVLDLALTQMDLANCQLRAGIASEAIKTYESIALSLEGLVEAEEQDEVTLFLLSYAKTEIGKIHKKNIQFEQAEHELAEALTMLDQILQQSPGKSQGLHRRLHVIAHLSFVLNARGKEDEAIALLRRGLPLATAQIRHPLALRATRDLTVRLCELLRKQGDEAECLQVLESSLAQVAFANSTFPAVDRSRLEEVRLLEYASDLRSQLGELQPSETALLRAADLLDTLLQVERKESVYYETAIDNSRNFSNHLLAEQRMEDAQNFLLSRSKTASDQPRLQYELASQLALCAQHCNVVDWRKVELQLQALALLRMALDSGSETRPFQLDARWDELRR